MSGRFPNARSIAFAVARLSSVGVVAVSAGLAGCASDPLAGRFQSHVAYLASDQLGGRGVGSPGIQLAAEYIADELASAGALPGGERGSYYQAFSMPVGRELTEDTKLSVGGVDLALEKDFIPLGFSSNESFSGAVVFCGYGIDAADEGRDDFAGVNLKGKVALVLRGAPASLEDAGVATTRHAALRTKVYNAKDREAAAILFVSSTDEADGDALIPLAQRGADSYGLPAFHITRTVAARILSKGGMGSLDEIEERLAAGSTSSGPLAHIAASGSAGFEQVRAPTRNVIGVVRGEGPLADEFVVIGAHYDHLGIREPTMRRFKGGKRVREKRQPEIHNGADDNASGVSGLLEIARMFAEGPAPKRSIALVAFTAEESGLHGSKHFVDTDIVPMSSVVAMLNMDMIGRMSKKERSVQVFGTGTGEGLAALVERAGRAEGVRIQGIPGAGGRSDHAPFVRKQIPSLHFFTGQHSDYHKPSDDADKVNSRGGAAVTRVVYRVAEQLANRDSRMAYTEPPKIKSALEDAASEDLPTYRVVMGLAPGYAEDGQPGMLVEAVSDDGPAEVAGMKAGDRIVRISDKPVANIYDYMAATRTNNPGDVVEVVVLRDGKELTLSVTLAGAG